MECFISNDDDRILLVGEGNFSFSVDLVYYAEKYFGKFFSHDEKYKIISTCFELENKISSIALLNANLLREKGIQVEFGIDARCLEQYAFLADEVHRQRPAFTRVIFNFPHVGGKMRIERNRKLLRDFLMSASQVLQPDGVVCVSLCAGQGGSTAENGVRRWDDSWKAVEAAGEADMLLTAVLPFPSADVLQQYASTGYRGLQKGFHFTDARVHVFCAATTPLPTPLTAEQLDNLLTRSSNNQTQYHADKILKNPWRKSSSVQSKFLDKFISITNLKLIDEIVVYDDFDYQSHGKETLLRCLQVYQLTNDFSLAPVECVLELFCKDAFGFALTTLKKLMKSEDLSTFIILRSDCNVTILVDRMLDGDWRKLWTNGVTCVSPREYTLDVTFSVREILNEEKLVDVLWAVGGDFIVNVQLLSEFVFGEGAKRNYCYRIVYMSYDLPLFRARVIGIHNEVVSKAVEYHLNASMV